MNNKLKIGFISNSALIKTGLSRNMKVLLPILYKTDKYEIFLLNQSMGDGDQNYQRFPWKNSGAMKNFDQNRFNQDPNYQRFVAYGNSAVESWVIENKLDVVLAFDDAWAFDLNAYIKSDWYNHMKQNFLFDITLDSEPIINHAKDLAKNCPNFHVWSGFAERVLKKEDPKTYEHIKTLRGAIDAEEFKPLPKQDRLDLRRKFGITDNEKIIFYLGRNQLRKNSFHANQEALALWKQKHPDKKIRLLFHTKFSEPSGWPIDQIRQEFKLDKEDILCTYFCRKCQDWNIQPYDGEDLNCPHCNGEKTRVTAGIDSTIDEHDLNKIYNIGDACCSSFTSGGQEYNLVESMLSGLPLACPFYSSGEDFILSGFVKEIEGSFYREFNTNFKKFTPNTKSILEFYEYIWNLDDKDRNQLTINARNWAIKEFDGKNIAKQIELFLDSCKPIDWEAYFNKKKELKDINAQIQDKQTDEEFIDHCYKTILKMDLPENDEGKIHWKKFLSQNGDKHKLKENLVNTMRQAGVQHNQKVQPQITLESVLDKEDKSRVLVVLKESIGDLFILSSLLPEIQVKYPESSIYVATDPKYFDIFEMNTTIKKLLPWSPEMDNELIMVGFANNKGLFNHYLNVGISTQKILNYLSSNY